MADALATGPRRVKLYILRDDEQWHDVATGHVRCQPHPENNAYVLRVVAEDTGRVIICSQIRPIHDAFYQHPESNIISWTEDEFTLPDGRTETTEVALSFAEPDACSEIWDKICQLDATKKQQQQQQQEKHASSPAQSLSDSPGSASSPHREQQQDHNDLESPPAPAQLTLPLSMVPQHEPPPGEADLLVSSGDSVMPPTSTTENNLHRNHHPIASSHISLVDPATADITHSSRFFEEALDAPNPWNTDPIEDVIFRESSSVLFLTGSPGGLVPSSSNSDAMVATGFAMPEPTRAGVEVLSRVLSDQGIIQVPAVRERVTAEVSRGDYISKLCQVFRACEKSTDLEGLSMLYHVIRCLFIIGTAGVLEVLVNEKNLMDVVGCLEYDPEHVAELERKLAEKRQRESERENSQTKDTSNTRRGDAVTEHSSDDSPVTSHERQDSGELRQDTRGDEDAEGIQENAPAKYTSEVADRCGQSELCSKGDVDAMDCSENSGKREPPPSQPGVDASSDGSRGTLGLVDEGTGEATGPKLEAHVDSSIAGASGLQNPSKVHCLAPKNLSEETTSSGNLIGEDGERRLIIRVHRDFLERKVIYKSVVPITDPNVVAKIHQNYRVAYIRDVILSRVFDDGITGTLSGVIVCNNVDIIMYFISGSGALKELFDRLQAATRKRRACRNRVNEEDNGKLSKNPKGLDECMQPLKNAVCGRQSYSDDVFQVASGRSDITESKCDRRSESESQQEGNRLSVVEKGVVESDVSDSTGGSNITALGDPSTSKEPSSHAPTRTEGGKQGDVSTDPLLPDDQEEVQQGLRVMLAFLRELCNIVKGQQDPLKNRFHSLLIELGVLEVSMSLLSDDDLQLRSLCCDILSAVVFHDQTEVRSYMLKSLAQPEKIATKKAGLALRSKPIADSSINIPRESSGTPAVTRPGGCVGASDSDENVKDDREHTRREAHLSMSSADDTDENVFNPGHEQSGTGSHGVSAPSAELEPSGSQSGCVSGARQDAKSSCGTVEKNLEKQGRSPGLKKRLRLRPSSGTLRRRADKEFPMLSAMVEAICQERESGVILTLLDLLKLLLDLSNVRTQSDKDVFLDVFYEKFAHRLLKPLRDSAETEGKLVAEGMPCESEGNVTHICDLLSFCVANHSFRAKYFVLGYAVGPEVARLLEHRKAFVRLSALRLIRSCVALADNVYDRYITRERLLDPIMAMFARNGNRDNLTSAAVLDLVYCIYHRRRFSLLKYLLTNHSETLAPSSTYCGAFGEAKKVLHELMEEKASNERQSGTAGKGRGSAGEDAVREQASGDAQSQQRTERADSEIQNGQVSRSSGGDVGAEPGGRSEAPILGEQTTAFSQDQDVHQRLFARCSDDGSAVVDFNALIDDGHHGLHGTTAQQVNEILDVQHSALERSEAMVAQHVGAAEQKGNSRPSMARQESSNPETLRACDVWNKPRGPDGNNRVADGDSPLVGYCDGDSDEDEESVRAEKRRSGGGGHPPKSTVKKGSTAIRLSLSKRDVRSGQVKVLSGQDGELFCESSEDSASPPKRGRSVSGRRGLIPGGGVETCTRAVMEDQGETGSDSRGSLGDVKRPPKHLRTEKSLPSRMSEARDIREQRSNLGKRSRESSPLRSDPAKQVVKKAVTSGSEDVLDPDAAAVKRPKASN